MLPAGLKAHVEPLLREAALLTSVIREKGVRRFARAGGMAVFMVFTAYTMLYRSPQSKSQRLDAEIRRAKMIHDYGEKYNSLRGQLQSDYARLPTFGDREQWLSNSVRASLDQGGLVSEDFRPTREQELNGLIFQGASVSLKLRFAEFYAWLLRLENARPMMRLKSFAIAKKTETADPSLIGVVSATCDVATVIPKKRLQ